MTPTPTSLSQELSDARELIDSLHQTEMRLRDELKQCDEKLSDALVALFDEREANRQLRKQLEEVVVP